MKMVIVAVIVAVLLVGGLAWYIGSQNSSPSTTSPTSSGALVAKDDASSSNSASNAGATGSNTAGSSNSNPAQTRVINVKALRFTYEPKTITVKKGERVNLVIDNSDTTHGIVIPDLSVSGIGSLEFTADKAGTFEFKCSTVCGSGHKDMKGTLIVEE